ncbi:MAG: AAA family ATPase [Blastocatellia bacterium]
MFDAAVLRQGDPFESASEFRDAQARLLEELDEEVGSDSSAEGEVAALARLEPRIRGFLQRGEATGVFIEEIKERTACQVLLDYWVSSLSQAGRPVGSVRLARFDGEQLPDLKDKPCPYVGLDAFRDRTFFFGREADIQALLAQLQSVSLLVVLGASGSGKSSLVIGGVLPALAAEAPGLCVIPSFVPGNTVLEHLADAVRQSPCGVGADVAAEVAALRQDPAHLRARVGGAGARPVVITIDQFEEVFTLSDQADREALVANLADLLKAGRGHRVILTMREEFRSRIVELQALSPNLGDAWYSMRPMAYAELKAAVEKPAALVNLQFQSGIADDLVKKVLGQAAALPLMQFTLRALWEKRDRNRITWEVYRKVGDPLNALKASAEEFYNNLADEMQNEVKRILVELVRVDELLEAYRQPVPKSRLLQAGSSRTEDVLRLLAEKDYVRVTAAAGDTDPVVEVKHESLVRNWPRFVSWIEEKRRQRRERLALTQAAERWAKSGKPQEGLLTGWQLETAESVTELLELEKEFVKASAEAVDRVQREKEAALYREAKENKAAANRFRMLWAVTIVLAGFAIYLLIKTQQSMKAEGRSHQRVLQAMRLQPLNYVDDQLDLALLLGIEGNRMPDVQPELRRALLSSLITNLELKSLFPGHTAGVRAVAFSSDGKILASGSYDSTIILWAAEEGLMLHPPLRGHTAPVYRVAFSPDGKTLASASLDRTVRLWEVKTGQLIGKPLSHNDAVYSVAIEKNGKILASGGKDGTVRLWNIESQKELGPPLIHRHSMGDEERAADAVYNVAFSPDGNIVASGGFDGRIILWDIKERKQAGGPLFVKAPVFSMAFSHNGTMIASGDNVGEVKLWDVGTRKVIKSLSPAHDNAVFGVAFSPDNTQLATVSTDRTAYIRDVVDKEAPPRQLKGYAERFLSVDFTADGNVVTGTENAMIVLWNSTEFNRFGTPVIPPNGDFGRVAFGDNANALISFSGRQLLFWYLSAHKEVPPVAVEAQGEIKFITLTLDRNHLVTIGADNSVTLWDVSNRHALKTLVQPSKDEIRSAALNVDNQTLAIGVADQIRLLSLSDETLKWTLPSSGNGKVGPLAFSPNGKLLASAQDEYGITIWDLAKGKAAIVLPDVVAIDLNHKNVRSLVFSKNGEILISGGKESVGFWDSRSGQPLGRRLAHHPGVVESVAVSADGKLLASGGSDNTVLLWDLDTRQPLSQPIRAHRTSVVSVDFSPDGRWLASASSEEHGSIVRWEVDTDTWLSRACKVVGRNFTEDEWKQFFGDQKFRITCPGVRATEADARALKGDRAGAQQFFREALDAAKDHEDNNQVCWMGSVNRFAKLVKPACEKAVELAPDTVTKRLYQDSRGLARALTGDRAGAIEDFTTALESIKAFKDLGYYDAALTRTLLRRRQDWIDALKEGRDPFDDAMLKSLRTESISLP